MPTCPADQCEWQYPTDMAQSLSSGMAVGAFPTRIETNRQQTSAALCNRLTADWFCVAVTRMNESG